jgi:hypothetical protein
LKEIVGKKKFNYDVLYQNFLFEMICSMSEKIGFLQTLEPYLLFVKSCLKSRFYVPSNQRDISNLKSCAALLCVLDEEIGDTLYSEGFLLDEHGLNEIVEILNAECSDALRIACQKLLFPTEFVSKYERSITICSGLKLV